MNSQGVCTMRNIKRRDKFVGLRATVLRAGALWEFIQQGWSLLLVKVHWLHLVPWWLLHQLRPWWQDGHYLICGLYQADLLCSSCKHPKAFGLTSLVSPVSRNISVPALCFCTEFSTCSSFCAGTTRLPLNFLKTFEHGKLRFSALHHAVVASLTQHMAPKDYVQGHVKTRPRFMRINLHLSPQEPGRLANLTWTMFA